MEKILLAIKKAEKCLIQSIIQVNVIAPSLTNMDTMNANLEKLKSRISNIYMGRLAELKNNAKVYFS